VSDQRDRRGRFLPGNLVRLKTGQQSTQVQAGALLPPGAASPADRLAALTADLGEGSYIKGSLAARYLHVELGAEWLEGNLRAQGILTSKGRQRAAWSAYLATVDRLVRLADKLGLQRGQKQVDAVAEVERAVERLDVEQ
jgi:hypothetical protein